MLPQRYAVLLQDTQAIDFPMGSDAATAALLRALAAGKPGGRLLELGTGTGLATCWLGVCTGKVSASLGRDLQGSKILAGRGQGWLTHCPCTRSDRRDQLVDKPPDT